MANFTQEELDAKYDAGVRNAWAGGRLDSQPLMAGGAIGGLGATVSASSPVAMLERARSAARGTLERVVALRVSLIGPGNDPRSAAITAGPSMRSDMMPAEGAFTRIGDAAGDIIQALAEISAAIDDINKRLG